MALANTGITTTLVGNTIGTSSRNVGALCTNTNINMWSRWKPTFTSAATLTEPVIAAADFSITLPASSNDLLTAVARGYTYKRPAGTSASPYRLGDFRNYSHTSVPPCKSTGNLTVDKSATTKIFIPQINLTGGSDGIGLNEINRDLKNYYIAIAFEYTYAGTNVVTYKTDSSTIGATGGLGIPFNLSTDYPFSLNVSSATYYWVACSKIKTDANSDGPADQMFYALPFNSPSEASGTVSVAGGGIELTFGLPTGIMQYYDETYVDDFRQYQPGVSSPERYFRVSNNGDFHLEYTVKNNTNKPQSVSLNDLQHTTTAVNHPSFASSQPAPTTGIVPLNWYQYISNRWQIIKSITLPAGDSVKLRLGQDGWAAYKNGSPTIGTETGLREATSIKLSLTGASLGGFVVNLSS